MDQAFRAPLDDDGLTLWPLCHRPFAALLALAPGPRPQLEPSCPQKLHLAVLGLPRPPATAAALRLSVHCQGPFASVLSTH